jgi:hypothetical protein
MILRPRSEMKLLSAMLVACASAVGCSSTHMKTDGGGGDADGGANDGRGNRAPLCDGVEHLRLWVLIAPGNEVRGSLVRVENGYPFVAIDGTCSYWIGGGWTEDALSRDRPIRTGKMTDADIAAVEQGVPLGDVATLGDCPPPPADLYDYSYRSVRTAGAEAACFTGAPTLTAGTRFEAAWTTLETIAGRLWDAGTPLNGALHVSAVDGASGASTPAYTWPLASPLASFLLDSADWFKVGVGHIVVDPTVAGQLRALRDRYLADRTAQPGLYVNWDGLEVTDQTTTGFVYMRDAIPYEDAQGLLAF